MTEPRFFVSPDAIHGERVTFSPEQSRQIARVLRLVRGNVVYALDNTGLIFTVRLEQVRPREVWGQIVDVREAGGEPPVHITLYLALLKGEKMDWALQKGTEVGVSRFVPVLTERTVVRRREKKSRWERILQEAAEQCGRGRIPTLGEIVPLARALTNVGEYDTVLIAHNGAGVAQFRDVVSAIAGRPQRVALFIGPEGGFTEAEVASARERGAMPVHLGPRVLRAETAAVVFSALVLHLWGDVG